MCELAMATPFALAACTQTAGIKALAVHDRMQVERPQHAYAAADHGGKGAWTRPKRQQQQTLCKLQWGLFPRVCNGAASPPQLLGTGKEWPALTHKSGMNSQAAERQLDSFACCKRVRKVKWIQLYQRHTAAPCHHWSYLRAII